jgi:hypothetical protein
MDEFRQNLFVKLRCMPTPKGKPLFYRDKLATALTRLNHTQIGLHCLGGK